MGVNDIRRRVDSGYPGRSLRVRLEQARADVNELLAELRLAEKTRDAFLDALVVICNGRVTAPAIAASMPQPPTTKGESKEGREG